MLDRFVLLVDRLHYATTVNDPEEKTLIYVLQFLIVISLNDSICCRTMQEHRAFTLSLKQLIKSVQDPLDNSHLFPHLALFTATKQDVLIFESRQELIQQWLTIGASSCMWDLY